MIFWESGCLPTFRRKLSPPSSGWVELKLQHEGVIMDIKWTHINKNYRMQQNTTLLCKVFTDNQQLHDSTRTLHYRECDKLYCTEAVRGCGSHDWRKLRRVFGELQLFTAAVKREDGSQTPEPKLSFPEDCARGFQLQAGLWYLHTTDLMYHRRVHYRVLWAVDLQERDKSRIT